MELGQIGVWFHTDGLASAEAADLAGRVEALGYGALWYGEGEIARAGLALYLRVPHQQRHFARMGFDAADWEGQGSDRLIDRIVAWGDEEALRRRVRDHLDAGATHVCIQPLGSPGARMPSERLLVALAPSGRQQAA